MQHPPRSIQQPPCKPLLKKFGQLLASVFFCRAILIAGARRNGRQVDSEIDQRYEKANHRWTRRMYPWNNRLPPLGRREVWWISCATQRKSFPPYLALQTPCATPQKTYPSGWGSRPWWCSSTGSPPPSCSTASPSTGRALLVHTNDQANVVDWPNLLLL